MQIPHLEHGCNLSCGFCAARLLGNVSEGVPGFFKFWFGEYMQGSRRMLDNKDRKSHPLCSRCKMADGRCDVPMWRNRDDMKGLTKNKLLDYYWDGASWVKLETYKG